MEVVENVASLSYSVGLDSLCVLPDSPQQVGTGHGEGRACRPPARASLLGHRQDFDRISRYRVLEDGKAEFIGLTEADKIPWGLTLSPDGKFLLVSATTGASLTAYRISPNGNLKKVASLAWDSGMSDLVAR